MTPDKNEARKAAFARRKTAFEGTDPAPARDALRERLGVGGGRVLAGYLAIGSEIDPRPVMEAWADHAPVCVPVIDGPGRPLRFRAWTPGCEMIEGPFATRAPAEGRYIEPDMLIVPLLAFDARGYRLGYGGGYYDRTLEGLRARRAIVAVGFAFAAQAMDEMPLEPTDQRLDAIVTEKGLVGEQVAPRLATPEQPS